MIGNENDLYWAIHMHLAERLDSRQMACAAERGRRRRRRRSLYIPWTAKESGKGNNKKKGRSRQLVVLDLASATESHPAMHFRRCLLEHSLISCSLFFSPSFLSLLQRRAFANSSILYPSCLRSSTLLLFRIVAGVCLSGLTVPSWKVHLSIVKLEFTLTALFARRTHRPRCRQP